MDGFYGRIVKIDVGKKTFDIEVISDDIYAKYLGGKGLCSYLLYTLNPPGVDPLSPENHLILATGPISGSTIWGSCRYGAFTKSPQTGFYSESYSGGKVPEAIDSTGFDAIVIKGQCEHPTVLAIYPEEVYFHDAGDLWGKETYETEDKVLETYARSDDNFGKPGASVIGPAAENLVRFGVIKNDHWRSCGRTGVGTVMGAKKVKAILFQGDRKRPLHDKDAVRVISKKIALEGKDNKGVNAYKTMGTSQMVKVLNDAYAFPTRYWSDGRYENWEKINSDTFHRDLEVKPHSCLKCFMSCGRMTTVLQGRHAGLKLEGPEYETIYAFGGLCLVDSIEEIAYLNDICDRMGMDTISAGNLCGFTIEAARRGKVDFRIDYGEVDAIAELLHMIARREGIGDILANGIKFAAKEWGLEDIAVHVKGMEPAGYDPRALKGMGLAYATSDRGACHLRATFYKPELSGMISPDQIEGKAKLFVEFEDRLTIFDTLIFCRFYRDMYPWEELSEVIHAVTGLDAEIPALQAMAADISTLIRRFNIREGLKPEDDRLPKPFYKKFEHSDHVLKEDELETMLKEYYALRGWDKNGQPT